MTLEGAKLLELHISVSVIQNYDDESMKMNASEMCPSSDTFQKHSSYCNVSCTFVGFEYVIFVFVYEFLLIHQGL